MNEAQSARGARGPGNEPPRVVIVGAGFGGLAAARGLGGSDLDVTIVDRQNHHLFQPLLYQVATAAVSPADVAAPVRSLVRDDRNIRVLIDNVLGVDPEGRVVAGRAGRYPYDFLVLAPGSEYTYFGRDDWRDHSLSLKSLEDALVMRERILLAFERAEMASDEAERRRLMTFVVVGGGPTGVELAGAIADLAKSTLARDFRRIVPGDAEIVLLEAGPGLLTGFPERLVDYAGRALLKKGVTVRVATPVRNIRDDGVVAGEDEAFIPAATVLWAAGTRAAGAGEWLGTGADGSGRVEVGSDLTVPDHPEIFVVGDAARVSTSGGAVLPGVAPVAKQEGTYVAGVIRHRAAGEPPPGPFRYRDEGMLATIGRGAAIGNLPRFRLTGWVAWMFWGLVHIYFLIGFRARIVVFTNWAWTYFTYGLGARLITGRVPRREPGSGAKAGPPV